MVITLIAVIAASISVIASFLYVRAINWKSFSNLCKNFLYKLGDYSKNARVLSQEEKKTSRFLPESALHMTVRKV